MQDKRCRCGRTMRRQFDDLFNCVCGTSWLAGEGFFTRTPDMIFETVVEKVGNQTKERRVIHRQAATPSVSTELSSTRSNTQKKAKRIPGTSEPRIVRVIPPSSDKIIRGGIYFLKDSLTEGAEIHSGRPAIVVSDVKRAYFGDTVTVVYLTSRPKNLTPTRVKITSTGDRSTALCETIDTVDTEKVGSFIAMTTPKEMMELKRAMAAHLGMTLAANP